jgi:hypothetical protein
MELLGWTHDPLIADRLGRLPQSEWVYGTPKASLVMTAFLRIAAAGMRFNSPELGAWYASNDMRTAAAEVGHHLRREAVARSAATMTRIYQICTATLLGDYLDIRSKRAEYPDIYASERYVGSQKFGEEVRASGSAGILYDSLRRRNGINVVALRPQNITDVEQIGHFEIAVSTTVRMITVRKLSR